MSCPNKTFKTNPNQDKSDWDILVDKIGIVEAYRQWIKSESTDTNYKKEISNIKFADIPDNNVFNKYDNKKTNELNMTNDQTNYALDVMSGIFNQLSEQYFKAEIHTLSSEQIRKEIYQEYEALNNIARDDKNWNLTQEQYDFNIKVLTDLIKEDSILYSMFKDRLLKTQDVDINKLDYLNENANEDTLKKEWDDIAQFSKSKFSTVNKVVIDFINATEKYDDYDNYGGLSTNLNAKQLFPELLTSLTNSKNSRDMISKLKTLNINKPHLKLKYLVERYENIQNKLDKNKIVSDYERDVYNALYTSFDLAHMEFERTTFKEVKDKDGKISYDIVPIQGNKSGYFFNNIKQTIINDIDNKIKNDTYTVEYLNDLTTRYKNIANEILNTKNTQNAIKELAYIYDKLNIDLNEDKLNKYLSNFDNPTSEIFKLSKDIIEIISDIEYRLNNPNVELTSNQSSRIEKIAKIIEMFNSTNIESGHIGVAGNRQYDFIKPNFLTNFFKDIHGNEKEAFEFLSEYVKDPKFQYDNIIWGNEYNEDKKTINKKNTGLLDYTVDENGIKVPFKLNEFTQDFNVILKEGNKSNEQSSEYSDSSDVDWKINLVVNFMQSHKSNINKDLANYTNRTPSDSGVMYEIVSKKTILNINDFKDFQNNPIKFRQSNIYKQFVNIFEQDYTKAIQAAKYIYLTKVENGIEKFVTDGSGNVVVRPEILDGTKPIIQYYHGEIVDGKFKPGNFNKFNQLVFEDNTGKHDILTDIKELFIPNTIIPILELSNENKELIYNKLYNHIDSFIKSVYSDILYEYSDVYKSLYELSFRDNKLFNTYEDLQKTLLEFALNYEIFNNYSSNLFYGDLSFYKNETDNNKRAKTVQSNKQNYNINNNTTFKALTISDVFLKSSVYDKIIKNIADIQGYTLSDEDIRKLNIKTKDTEKLYKDEQFSDELISIYETSNTFLNNDAANAQSYITIHELERRLKMRGTYSKYKEIVEKEKKGIPLSFNEITSLNEATLDVAQIKQLQAQKNFYYSYRFNPQYNMFVPVQVKNSEQVLLNDLIKGSQLEQMRDSMYKLSDVNNPETVGNIQIDVESSTKIGAETIVTLHDKDGNILDLDIDNLKTKLSTRYYADLGVQLDVPDHMVDEENKLGVQIARKILDNIIKEESYRIKGKQIKGEDVITEYFDHYTKNIKESYDKIYEELVLETKDGINIYNIEKITELLKKELTSRGANSAIIDGLELIKLSENIVGNKVPFDFNNVYKKNMAVISSIVTNNVINQKFPGFHATQMSNLFVKRPKVIKQYENDITGIEYTNEVLNRPEGNELQFKYYDDANGNQVVEVEVLIPRFSSQFFKKNKKSININEIPSDILKLLGYRIPTEAKHSMIAMKVVGFLPEGTGSTIIIPSELITQTGSNFAIDSIYAMTYNFKRNKDNTFDINEYSKNNDTLESRQNRMLDIMLGLLTDPKNHIENISAQGYDAVLEAKNKVDAKSKQPVIRTNSLLSQLRFKKLALEGRALKGLSVNRDGFLSIAQLTNMKLQSEYGLKVKYTKKEGYNLDIIRKNYKDSILEDTGDSITINHTSIGKSDSNHNNILDKKLTQYASQVTANAFDIIKFPFIENLNTYTFGVFKTFVDLGSDYINASAFIKQDILIEVSKRYFNSKGIIKTSRRSKEIELTKGIYQAKLYKALVREGKIQSQDFINKKIRKQDGNETLFIPSENNKEYYNILGYKNEEYTTYSNSELLDIYSLDKNSSEYLRHQLQILENFKNIAETSSYLEEVNKVTITDKLEASPDMTKIKRLFKDINNIKKQGEDYPILIDNTNVIDKIYPTNIDDSVYKPLAYYYQYGHKFSYDMISNLFIQESVIVNRVIDNVEDSLGKKLTDKEKQDVVNATTSYLLSGLQFISENTSYDINRILGKDQEYKDVDITNIDNYDEYQKLSTENKLELVRKYFKEQLDEYKGNHILSALEIRNRNGKEYSNIAFTETFELNDMIESFNSIWYNDNVFIKSLAQDLLKYDFYENGFNFNNKSLIKIVSPDILFNEYDGTVNSKGIGLTNYIYDLKSNIKDYVTSTNYVVFEILRSSLIDKIIPNVKDKKYNTNSEYYIRYSKHNLFCLKISNKLIDLIIDGSVNKIIIKKKHDEKFEINSPIIFSFNENSNRKQGDFSKNYKVKLINVKEFNTENGISGVEKIISSLEYYKEQIFILNKLGIYDFDTFKRYLRDNFEPSDSLYLLTIELYPNNIISKYIEKKFDQIEKFKKNTNGNFEKIENLYKYTFSLKKLYFNNSRK